MNGFRGILFMGSSLANASDKPSSRITHAKLSNHEQYINANHVIRINHVDQFIQAKAAKQVNSNQITHGGQTDQGDRAISSGSNKLRQSSYSCISGRPRSTKLINEAMVYFKVVLETRRDGINRFYEFHGG